MDDLVIQLGLMARRFRNQLSSSLAIGSEAHQYQQSNRRGPGASNFKGD